MYNSMFESNATSGIIPSVDEASKAGKRTFSSDISGTDKIDSLIAGALTRLSLQEREDVYEEVHGVRELVEETDEFIALHLRAFASEIDKIKQVHDKAYAYRLAESISFEYVNDPRLRLKFLRCEKFNIAKSTERMITFFDIKLYLFGAQKLCQDITLRDLDRDDMATMKAGFMQLLPVRDRSGRTIFVLFPSHQTYKVAENMTRAMFYLVMSAMDDEESQKKGITAIIYNVGKFVKEKFDHRTVSQGCWISKCLPVRVCALHHCFNDPGFRFIINISMHFFSKDVISRAKMHYGTHMECLYSLMTFGVPTGVIPVTMDGVLKQKNHKEFLKVRHQHETDLLMPRIIVPTHRDVLFGRGKPFREHRGNMRLFDMLDDNLGNYEAALMKTKTVVISEMVAVVKKNNGRFLKQDKAGCWVEVEEKQAKEKVSHAFRTRIRIASTSGSVKIYSQNVKPETARSSLSISKIKKCQFEEQGANKKSKALT